jgi:hypothetical protein
VAIGAEDLVTHGTPVSGTAIQIQHRNQQAGLG